jgi:acetoacetate decarboxylase
MYRNQILNNSFSMPYHCPSYPKGPFRFVDREYLIITYETDLSLLKSLVPEPLFVDSPIVKYEFIKMPDSSGFGNYTESGQVIPVSYEGIAGDYVFSMYLDCQPPIAAGREIWGFPKTYANPSLSVKGDVLEGRLNYQGTLVALGTMGYKYKSLDISKVQKSFENTNYLLKILPHVDGSLRVCELVGYQLQDVVIKGAWEGPGQLELISHALAPVNSLPIKKVISAVHILSDLTLPYGKVIYDYLK